MSKKNTTASSIAKHILSVHFGGNWTAVNLRDVLNEVSFEQALVKLENCNTIAQLVFHMHYFIRGVLDVLHGGELVIKDKYSYDLPDINSVQEWNQLLEKYWVDVRDFASAIEKLSDDQLNEVFVKEAYGTYYDNLTGIIEHCHYHLGQIVIIKKIIEQ